MPVSQTDTGIISHTNYLLLLIDRKNQTKNNRKQFS